ncbi:MAG: DNA-processing protein DprA [bacterium]|nr:DNA-processing protein DprA [bacterium]
MQATIRILERIPASLTDIPGSPGRLYCRGTLPGGPFIAVVGTRKPTAYGRRIAGTIAGRLARAGAVVVSGLAFGIDAIAHQACLDAGGKSVAILPSGLNDADIAPRTNLGLARRILEQGALLSEYPEGSSARKEHYEDRNRLISGLAEAVVVVEAGRPSGTLITARHAGDQGREVWAVPGPIDSFQSKGTNWLIEVGAEPLFSVDAFMESRGLAHTRQPRLGESRLAALFDGGSYHIDEIAARLGRSTSELESELTKLELTGVVRHLGGRRYTLT